MKAATPLIVTSPLNCLGWTNRVNSTGWTHDAAGNVTATPDGTFSIDAAGRTIGHTPASGPALAFAFDATGLRTKRTEGASTTLYLRDGGQVVGEWNGTSWTKEYVWLGSTLLAAIEGSTIQYHHQDHLSIRATTFADGMVGEEQGHYPFGEPWYETSPETTRIFTTYEREAGGSLDYAMFRWMGSEAGRFLSADPVHGSMGDGQSWNRYAYAGNDPVNRWDPWGLYFTDDPGPSDIGLGDGPYSGGGGGGGGEDECYWQCIEVEPNKFICICVPPVDVTVTANGSSGDPCDDPRLTPGQRYMCRNTREFLNAFGEEEGLATRFWREVRGGNRRSGESLFACARRNADEATGGWFSTWESHPSSPAASEPRADSHQQPHPRSLDSVQDSEGLAQGSGRSPW
jgi:RHS repeat-associated protein